MSGQGNLTRDELFNDIFGSRRPDEDQQNHQDSFGFENTDDRPTLDPAKSPPIQQFQKQLNINDAYGQQQQQQHFRPSGQNQFHHPQSQDPYLRSQNQPQPQNLPHGQPHPQHYQPQFTQQHYQGQSQQVQQRPGQSGQHPPGQLLPPHSIQTQQPPQSPSRKPPPQSPIGPPETGGLNIYNNDSSSIPSVNNNSNRPGRLQPITTTDPSSAPISQRYQQSPTMSKYSTRSPILQQGINLLTRNSRTVTSPDLISSSSFGNSNSIPSNQSQFNHSNNPNFNNNNHNNIQPLNNSGRSMSLNSSSFRNLINSDSQRKNSSGGRSIQKSDFTNGNNNNNGSNPSSNSNSSSSSSSMGLGLKTRSLSSIAKARRVSSSASLSSHRVSSSASLSSRTIVTTASRSPQVYPAMLSRVATLFKKNIVLAQYNKDGLEYRDAFTGSDAVDVISHIIRTTDRNLALLLGRALDAQKFFHDVTYEHRLRDSNREVYQFDEVFLNASSSTPNGSSQNLQNIQGQPHHGHVGSNFGIDSRNGSFVSESTIAATPGSPNIDQDQQHSVNGVFTLLTECYSPTCTRDALCYSIACPRRLEQQARLNMKPQGGLKRNESHLSLHEEEEKKQLWSHTVPKEMIQAMDKKEVKRQELIYEVVATERTFVRNLEYLRDFWIRPLRESNIIPIIEREKFIRTVFFNVIDILNVAIRFRDALIRRQQLKPVVENIGDIFLEFIPFFEPFVSYNAGQCFAKYELERQKAANPLFARFIEETERLPESNRLNISSYLSQATTRTVRYNLLLKDIIKSTKEDSFDKPDLLKASDLILKLLERINVKVGKAEDRHALILLKQRLVFRPGEYVDLKLGSDQRKIVYTAPLKKRNQDKDNQGDIQIYLMDHLLLFVRVKVINKREQHKVYQRPIPLPLLYLSASEEMPSLRPYTRKSGAYAHVIHHPSKNDTKFPISFAYIGRRGYELTLYGATNSAQESLISIIEQQQNKIREKNDIFTLTPLAERFFDISNRINCLAPCDGGRRLLYGTDSGVFMSEIKTRGSTRVVSKPVRIVSKVNVTQLEVLEEYQTLLVLADKKLYAWPLELLIVQDKKTGKELMSHVSFFKVGVCGGKILVVAAKSDLIRVFEPTDPFSKKMSKKKFKNETREFHFNSEPVSISFLKTRLIVGCTKGFEIVSLNDGNIEAILDPADTSLDFIINKEGLKPLAIHRISSNFLLSYSDCSFFINKNGWRTRYDFMINWEGIPQNFALWYPYLLAFESNFIEIRHVETGELLRVIIGENIRLLHTGSQEILYAYEDERGYDVVASLDFWDKTNKKETSDGTVNQSKIINTNESLSSGNNTLTEIKEVDEGKRKQ
ncbi:RHO1 GDP-GTP exchange protein 2 [Wickerhamomyces ciferrii]|uniref:RHO1 GDP-GTP exchange protein 2 n=1 Tax=Wickerhamomyces ciferrii (strain ATCC 14091 / BCRC 22168 / CBS 111 / JCM 3599 / NBRC 0793 / NRRL Y-1031 F-60-10) TaxID=1206466 RepID=K0L082_WICCF|nr:RHO1 GDP-GTP exchange protein 2 [Wickerhamomyces ciferrii]CCH47019.1 RHO1 GDP-GTP exchange protein 2 [Wickerhamomyces ciferrii]